MVCYFYFVSSFNSASLGLDAVGLAISFWCFESYTNHSLHIASSWPSYKGNVRELSIIQFVSPLGRDLCRPVTRSTWKPIGSDKKKNEYFVIISNARVTPSGVGCEKEKRNKDKAEVDSVDRATGILEPQALYGLPTPPRAGHGAQQQGIKALKCSVLSGTLCTCQPCSDRKVPFSGPG